MAEKHSLDEMRSAIAILRFPAGEKDDSEMIATASEVLHDAVSELMMLRRIADKATDLGLRLEDYRREWRFHA